MRVWLLGFALVVSPAYGQEIFQSTEHQTCTYHDNAYSTGSSLNIGGRRHLCEKEGSVFKWVEQEGAPQICFFDGKPNPVGAISKTFAKGPIFVCEADGTWRVLSSGG